MNPTLPDTWAVTPGWETPPDVPVSEARGGTWRGPSSRELAAELMPDDRARMENAKKEKVARRLVWFCKPLPHGPAVCGWCSRRLLLSLISRTGPSGGDLMVRGPRALPLLSSKVLLPSRPGLPPVAWNLGARRSRKRPLWDAGSGRFKAPAERGLGARPLRGRTNCPATRQCLSDMVTGPRCRTPSRDGLHEQTAVSLFQNKEGRRPALSQSCAHALSKGTVQVTGGGRAGCTQAGLGTAGTWAGARGRCPGHKFLLTCLLPPEKRHIEHEPRLVVPLAEHVMSGETQPLAARQTKATGEPRRVCRSLVQ